jgi:hypothetical protein
MNCQSFEEIVNEVAREQLSGQTTEMRDLAQEHAKECAECENRWRDERALSLCLNEMAKDIKSFAAPARVEDELLKAFRQRPEVRSQRSEIRGRWNRWLVAAAAVLLIMIGIGGLRRYLVRQSPAVVGSGNALLKASPESPQFRVEIAPEKSSSGIRNDSSGQPKNVVKRTNPRRQQRESKDSRQVLVTVTDASDSSAESEVATQFMPLDYSGPMSLQDGGQLVRVELSRSVMLNLGVPVNMDRYGEKVKADVFVGPDGLARAIRFVQ